MGTKHKDWNCEFVKMCHGELVNGLGIGFYKTLGITLHEKVVY